jgi:hypothetical protein
MDKAMDKAMVKAVFNPLQTIRPALRVVNGLGMKNL